MQWYVWVGAYITTIAVNLFEPAWQSIYVHAPKNGLCCAGSPGPYIKKEEPYGLGGISSAERVWLLAALVCSCDLC